MTSKYAIGVDFGTESGRVVIVDIADGREVSSAIYAYPDGVIDEKLPGSGVVLEPDWALQNPDDYLKVMRHAIPEALKKGNISADQIIGIGIDFTACTMLPTKADGTPLCLLPEYANRPHAWVKLWKHHAAQPEANKLNAIAAENGYDFLDRYGGKISSEWFVPKVMQILDEDPEIYDAADRMIEACDWVIWSLTENETRNLTTAGYKGLWSKREGFPPNEFFKLLDPRLENLVDEKMSRDIWELGRNAGNLTEKAASKIGLLPGIAVAVANVDAHAAVPAATVTEPGRMVISMGTSSCHMVLGETENIVPGMCGYVEDGILAGLFGYEAGQSAVGDHFAWFVENCVPGAYEREAEAKGVNLHNLLEEKAANLLPGESGLVALDWWNGNRSVLVDVDLTGMILGMTLATRPEEIYRALIEATAYGTRVIIEAFEAHGVPVHEIVAAGGLPGRNKLLMQIYADICGRPINTAGSDLGGALGAAMWASVAAGAERGGHASIQDATRAMTKLGKDSYAPNPAATAVYDQLYAEYLTLHDYFGRGENDVMKRLKNLKADVLKSRE